MGLFDDLIPAGGSDDSGYTISPDTGRPRITVRPLRQVTPAERDLMVRTVMGEAADQPDEGQAAVAHVIMNRVNSGKFGKDIPNVVLAPKQFEPWQTRRGELMAYDPQSPAYKRADAVVEGVLSGSTPDPTGGATHFLAPDIVRQRRGGSLPDWANGDSVTIGGHAFYAPGGKLNVAAKAAQQPEPAQPAGLFADLIPEKPSADETATLKELSDLSEMKPRVGTGQAVGLGALSGVGAGFNDEVVGASQASGLPEWLGGLRAPVGVARMLYEGATGNDGPAMKAYRSGRDRVRALQKAAREKHPSAYTAGEVGGALATIPFAPQAVVAKGAGMVPRAVNAAANGGLYGALYGAGEGEGAADTVEKAVTGGLVGTAAGGLASPVIHLAGRGAAAVTAPIRAAISPDVEAARRTFRHLAGDNPRATPSEVARAMDHVATTGEPLVLADLGGEGTRALARSSANTSPAGREALQAATGPRFQDQGQRIADDIRYIVGGNPESVGAREAIHAAAERTNKANYAAAYQHPNAQALWDEGFQQLSTAPVVQEAIKAATKTGLNKAAADGFRPPRNPFEVAADGSLTLKRGPDGEVIKPTLQFWDHVKRNLDDKISSLLRSGEKSAAMDAQKLRQALVDRLDDLVPSFKRARSQAAEAFGAEDALSAGESFVTSRMGNEEARRALAKMTPEQKQAFAHGFASQMIKKIAEVAPKDKSTVASQMFLNSSAAKERIEMALGPDGARRLEARVRIENIMEQTRAAVTGNSTTARQLAEAGLAGGVGVGYGVATGDYDVSHMTAAALTGALLRSGHRQIDGRLARRVGELLASNDPQRIREAANLASKSPRIMDAIRRADSLTSRLLGTHQPLSLSPTQGKTDEQERAR